MQIVRRYYFDAAHRLTAVPIDHPCGALHGHRFEIVVRVSGPVNEDKGWVVDFGEVDGVVKPLIALLDHCWLNDIAGMENPTSENIAIWLWERLSGHLGGLEAIEVWESPDAGCVFLGT